MTHIDHLIPDYFVPDALTQEERQRIDDHIQQCDACYEAFDDWSRISEAARHRASAAILPPLSIPIPSIYENGGKPDMQQTIPLPHAPQSRSMSWTLVASISALFMAGLLVIIRPSFNPTNVAAPPLQGDETELPNAYEWLRDDGRFTEMVTIIEDSDMLMRFFTRYEITVFALADDQFQVMMPVEHHGSEPPPSQESINIVSLLRYAYPAADVLEQARQLGDRDLVYYWRSPYSLASDQPVGSSSNIMAFRMVDGEMTVRGTRIIEGDIPVANGTIHVIDRPIHASSEVPNRMGENPYSPRPFWEVLGDDERVETFITLLEESTIANDTIQENTPFTLFVPVDAGFGDPQNLNNDETSQRRLIETHMLPGLLSTDMLLNAERIDNPISSSQFEFGAWYTFPEQFVFSQTSAGDVLVNGRAIIIEANIITPYGIIHLIDRPLIGYTVGNSEGYDATSRRVPTATP